MSTNRLRLVVFQDGPNAWLARGLEHDITAEGHTIGCVLRAALRLVAAHTAFDLRHALEPLAAFPPSPQKYWNAFTAGTPIPLTQLGIVPAVEWDIQAAFATRLPWDVPMHREARGAFQATYRREPRRWDIDAEFATRLPSDASMRSEPRRMSPRG